MTEINSMEKSNKNRFFEAVKGRAAFLNAAALVLGGAHVSRADEAGGILRDAFIWAGDASAAKGWLHGGFRRDFDVAGEPASAKLELFAYTRYMLFVNGRYVGRGPNRFESRRPEYDTWDVSAYLRPGRNSVSVIVHRDWPGEKPTDFNQSLSRMRKHAPGFTARLRWEDGTGAAKTLQTDTQWAGFAEKAFADPVSFHYSSIPESIDSRKWPSDWTAPDFDASTLSRAKAVDVTDRTTFPELEPRSIPLLRETPVVLDGPARVTLKDGEKAVWKYPRTTLAYAVLDINATPGTRLTTTGGNTFIARGGRQRWIGGDVFATREFNVAVTNGQATVEVHAVEVRYPFDLVGRFESSDPLLNRIWAITAASTQLLSEDAYIDCGDRERSEWMDSDPPLFDATRVMMVGPGQRWGDPRLYANMLLRVALSQEPSGNVRARTCSELLDIHTVMEDRACGWVQGVRKYYECTSDTVLPKRIWPYVRRQLDAFLTHRTESGLIRLREWVVWDNPMRYVTSEGTALNAFLIKAFRDAAYMAGQIGEDADAARFQRVSDEMTAVFNRLLWDEKSHAYYAAHGSAEIPKKDAWIRGPFDLKRDGDFVEPTFHANLFALDQGIVPPERKADVIAYLRAHEAQARETMVQFYYSKALYALNDPKSDRAVLDRMRTFWKPMTEWPGQTTWESSRNEGSKMHCYGINPGYLLSTYVLGVRRDAPVHQKQILIEPHLADLASAQGVVVTEFGPVKVSWIQDAESLMFEFVIPEGITAVLQLPGEGTLDGNPFNQQDKILKTGRHSGRVRK